MSTGIDIWVCRPGYACAADDGDWRFTVSDAHATPFAWGPTSYANLNAPQGHWSGGIPPGTYVVSGRRQDGTLHADSAIVTVDAGTVAAVMLWVDDTPGKRPSKRPSRDCQIVIREALATGRDTVSRLEVTGEASGCSEVMVTVRRGDHHWEHQSPVDKSRWNATFDLSEYEVECGSSVYIEVTCIEDPKCRADLETTLRCRRP